MAAAMAMGTKPAVARQATGAAADTIGLDHVEELVRAGRTEDARALLLEWWAGPRAKASARDVQRGLWLRGRLTVDPGQAELDYRRLVVEYPGGPYSAEALFRLAQGAWEAGDSVDAARQVARLGREYPGSRFRTDAERWLAAAGSPPPPPVVDTAQAPATADTTAAPPATVSGVSPLPPERTDTVTGVSARYAVQLGAFSTDERARTVQRKAQDAGFEARLVHLPGSRLVHVRVGTFDSSAAATELLRRLEELGFTVAVVTDANREERIRT